VNFVWGAIGLRKNDFAFGGYHTPIIMNTTIPEMRLRDYGYNTKKNDVLRERALTSACSEKGEHWVNTQLRDMLRVARESESIVLFKDKCNFIGSSPEEEIKKIMDEYERILYNMVVHTKNYDVVHTEFLNNAVIQIGWRNVCKGLDLKYYKNDGKVAEKIKKDMDYVIEVHSHRKKRWPTMLIQLRTREKEVQDEKEGKEDNEEKEIKKIMDEYEEILLNMVIHTKNYDFVHKEFLDYAVINVGWRNVCNELENLKNNKQGVKVAEKIKKDMDYVIEVHSHRNEEGDEDESEEGDEDESEEDGKSEDISLRDYGYAVHKTQGGRIAALRRAVASEGMDLVCARLERLGQYHPVMLEDLETLRPSDDVDIENGDCKCVSAQEIRNIVREELLKVFGDLKKMNEDIREMYIDMIV